MVIKLFKKSVLIFFIFLFFSANISIIACQTVNKKIDIKNIEEIQEKLSRNIIYVGGNGPGNYSNIQNAVENATDGDVIFVYSGTYVENLIINKSIQLIGEDKYHTIIDGNQKGSTVTIESEFITVENFTITGGGNDYDGFIYFFRAGIRVTSSNNIIQNNIIKNNRIGISGVRVTNLTINNNIFQNDGIIFTPYENDGRPHIKLDYFMHNIENNTVNGKKVCYVKNQINYEVPYDVGLLIAVNCSQLILKNATLSEADATIILAYCSNSLIQNCTISKSEGIWLFESDKNIFQFNNFSDNYLHGITLDYFSNKNVVRYNIITNNNMVGVMIEWYSKGNFIFKNNFINNSFSCYQIQSFRNVWLKNYYWNDWIGIKIPFLSIVPKIVFGKPIERLNILFPLGVDMLPASNPYYFDNDILNF
jgi:parallel beta-helix repeat protein